MDYEIERMLRWAQTQPDPVAALKERLDSDQWELSRGPHRFDRMFVRDSVAEIDGIKGALAILAKEAADPNKPQALGRYHRMDRTADRIDGYDRDDLGESPDY